jgi:endoglucanase
VFVAHLDHPGFLFPHPGGARRLSPTGPWQAEVIFEGRVDDRFFPGAKLRLHHAPGDPGIPAHVVEAHPVDPETDDRTVIIEADEDATGAFLGVWDVPAFAHDPDTGLLHLRAADDLAGAAAMVEALARLATADEIDVAMIFTRAEEAGFCGALCLLKQKPWPGILPRDSVFVSVEISAERQTARVGDGALIRTGDRSTTFDGPVCDMLYSLAYSQRIKARRALMDGGTCEATAFAREGFRCGGVCAPVRHYHNMNQETGRLVPEIISHGDLEALVQLIAGLAKAYISNDMPMESPICNDYDLFLRKGRAKLHPVPPSEPRFLPRAALPHPA